LRAEHSWQIADGAGTALAELTTAAGKTLSVVRDHFVECQAVISHHDAAASLLLDALSTGIPQLRVYRRSAGAASATLIFRGNLAPFTEDVEESALLSLVFRSPFARLLGDGSDRGRFTGEVFERFATDAGQIAFDLLDFTNTEGDTGLGEGTRDVTVSRDRAYQYANIGEAIVDLSRVADGFDFSETFIESGATLANLNIHASLGDDRPDAKFEYGETTLNNVRALSRTQQPPINAVRVLGANGLVGTAEHAVSIDTYDLWPLQASASDIDIQSALDEKAEALLRPNWIKTVDFTPEYGLANCPQPFDDFDVGDTVRFFARREALAEDVAVRVNGLTIVVDENGYEVTEIQDPLTPDEEAFIRANLSLEVVEE